MKTKKTENEKKWEEIKQQDEGVFQKQADGWMPWGWQGDAASGCGRLWFPDLPLKGLTSDAPPHPTLRPSTHPSLPLSFLFAFGVNKFCFPLGPLRDRGPHIYSSRERERCRKGGDGGGGWCTNPSDVQDVEPWEGQCEDERTDRSCTYCRPKNNRRRWKACAGSWKVVTASKGTCDDWNEVKNAPTLKPARLNYV